MKLNDIITPAQYQELDEGARRAYKKVDNNITQYYRCTSGAKKGKLAKDPQSCGTRKNPKRVRHGRITAAKKGAVRARKTEISKKKSISQRVTQLNKSLRTSLNTGIKNESMIDFIMNLTLVEQHNDYDVMSTAVTAMWQSAHNLTDQDIITSINTQYNTTVVESMQIPDMTVVWNGISFIAECVNTDGTNVSYHVQMNYNEVSNALDTTIDPI